MVEIDRLTVCVHGTTVPEPFGRGNPDALAAAIVRTVADPDAALARASQAWTTVRDSYGIGSTADGVAAVWSGVAGLARGGPRHPGPGGPTR